MSTIKSYYLDCIRMIIKGFILLIADPLAEYFNIYDHNNI
jgi:hypothetical protein